MKDSRWRSLMLRPHMRAWVALLLAAVCSAGAGTEALRRDFHFQVIGGAQGLAQNSIAALLQDRAGYLWVGTQGGLQRYDGYSFRTFEHAETDASGMGEGPVSALLEDAQGTIWIGTTGTGVARLDAVSGSIVRVPLPNAASAELANVRALALDASGGIWAGTDAGISRIDAKGAGMAAPLALPRVEGRGARVRQMKLADDGTLWIASSLGLYKLAAQSDTLERVGGDVLDDVAALLIDHDHRIYAGSYDGLYAVAAGGAATRVWPE
ncbi:MAG: ligand-binding sensor domain-containing protein, partial [Rhodanobacteraceae bacterium]